MLSQIGSTELLILFALFVAFAVWAAGRFTNRRNERIIVGFLVLAVVLFVLLALFGIPASGGSGIQVSEVVPAR